MPELVPTTARAEECRRSGRASLGSAGSPAPRLAHCATLALRCSLRSVRAPLHRDVWCIVRQQPSFQISIYTLLGAVGRSPRRQTMAEQSRPKENWASLLKRHAPLQLPAAHDALTAKLVQRAGFHAYQIGGFALVGARHGLPDVDLNRFAEQSAGVRDIMAACDLPVLVDADDGYGDAKNVTHTIASYEAMGVSAVFIEDQVSPKRCGHMSGKEVVSTQIMVERIEAAVNARPSSDLFIVARTDALAVEGLDAALKR